MLTIPAACTPSYCGRSVSRCCSLADDAQWGQHGWKAASREIRGETHHSRQCCGDPLQGWERAHGDHGDMPHVAPGERERDTRSVLGPHACDAWRSHDASTSLTRACCVLYFPVWLLPVFSLSSFSLLRLDITGIRFLHFFSPIFLLWKTMFPLFSLRFILDQAPTRCNHNITPQV